MPSVRATSKPFAKLAHLTTGRENYEPESADPRVRAFVAHMERRPCGRNNCLRCKAENYEPKNSETRDLRS